MHKQRALTQLLWQLKELQEAGPKDPTLGICQVRTYETRPYFREIWEKWPKYSGMSLFPVPEFEGQQGKEAVDSFYKTNLLWDKNTEYGRNRWELLEWLIKEIQIQLSKT